MGYEHFRGQTLMFRLYFIIEGYTEEKFIKFALIPYLKYKTNNELYYNYLNLNGKIKLTQLRNCIKNSIAQYDYVTTFIDLAGSRTIKFDNYEQVMNQNIPSSEKACLLEQQLTDSISLSQNKFIAHIQPYEFEALCFADLDGLARTDPKIAKHIFKIKQESKGYLNAESINNRELPATRLVKYGYVKQSTTFANYCNIDKIRKGCPHFSNWLLRLENKINISS